MAESDHIPIKSWANDDRPREKMLAKGRQSLSDSELLAIILGSGSRGESAVQLSQRILSDHKNNLHELGRVSISDLTKYHGVGEAKAINILAALELGRRRSESTPLQKPIIKDSRSAYNVFKPLLEDLPHEEFWIALCNKKNVVLSVLPVGRGGVGSVVVDIKIILKAAIENLASMIVVCHNHPSGEVTPSREDRALTEKLKGSAKLIDLIIADHIIIGNNKYYSFADEGLL